MEEGVIDCTTEEGQAALKDFEAQERAALAAKKADEPAGDPEQMVHFLALTRHIAIKQRQNIMTSEPGE